MKEQDSAKSSIAASKRFESTLVPEEKHLNGLLELNARTRAEYENDLKKVLGHNKKTFPKPDPVLDKWRSRDEIENSAVFMDVQRWEHKGWKQLTEANMTLLRFAIDQGDGGLKKKFPEFPGLGPYKIRKELMITIDERIAGIYRFSEYANMRIC